MGAFEGLADFIADFKKLRSQVAGLAIAVTPEATHYIGSAGEPAFEHSWVNVAPTNPARFYKHAGRVYLAGLISTGSSATVAFTLPAGYTAENGQALFICLAGAGNAFGYIAIDVDGKVTPVTGTGNVSTFAALDGISFRHT